MPPTPQPVAIDVHLLVPDDYRRLVEGGDTAPLERLIAPHVGQQVAAGAQAGYRATVRLVDDLVIGVQNGHRVIKRIEVRFDPQPPSATAFVL